MTLRRVLITSGLVTFAAVVLYVVDERARREGRFEGVCLGTWTVITSGNLLLRDPDLAQVLMDVRERAIRDAGRPCPGDRTPREPTLPAKAESGA